MFWIDRRDCIVRVNEAWTAFALANDAPELVAERVLRQSMWDFVVDETTRHLYADILLRVRKGANIQFPLRCDAPAMRRHLRMLMSGGDDGIVRFESHVVTTQARPAQGLWDRHRPRSTDLLRTCSWCKRVDVAGEWLGVEDAIARLGLFDHRELPGLTHCMCARCLDEMIGVRPPPVSHRRDGLTDS